MEQTQALTTTPPVSNLPEFFNHFMGMGLTKPQASYVMLAEMKRELMADLEKLELEYQATLLNAEDTVGGLTDALAKARKIYDEANKKRLSFTGFIDKNVIQAVMQPEKRIDYKTNEEYKKKDARLLELRIKRDEELDAANARREEEAKYLAYIKNENTDIITQFKTLVAKFINDTIAHWLEKKVESPDFKYIETAINNTNLREAVRFTGRKLITDEDAKKLIAEWRSQNKFPTPDIAQLRTDAIEYAKKKFSLYQQDLAQVKSRPEVIEQIQNQAQAEVSQIIDAGETTKMVNDLVASSVPMPTPEGKKVVTFFKVNSAGLKREEAALIMMTFAANPVLDEYIKVKDWGNLKISQMANAIADYATDKNVKFDGIQYNADKK